MSAKLQFSQEIQDNGTIRVRGFCVFFLSREL